jgi:hypothetical protein
MLQLESDMQIDPEEDVIIKINTLSSFEDCVEIN